MRNSTNLRPDLPFNSSILKSAIQKSIRRGEVDKALATTKSLIDKDPVGCLRRLLVVILEDSMLHPDYAKLAVLTDRARQKGMTLTEEDKSLVLTIVADITRCEWRDFEKDNPDYAEGYKIAKLEDEELALINAMNYRVRIGGWKDDMEMLRKFARIWAKRFAEGTWNVDKLRSYFSGEVAEYSDVAYAGIADIPIEAADFHVFGIGKILLKKPYIATMIQEAMPHDTRDWAKPWTSDEDILYKVCWCLRSGISFKRVLWTSEPVNWLKADKIPQEYWLDFRSIYDRIEGELDSIGRWFLDKANS